MHRQRRELTRNRRARAEQGDVDVLEGLFGQQFNGQPSRPKLDRLARRPLRTERPQFAHRKAAAREHVEHLLTDRAAGTDDGHMVGLLLHGRGGRLYAFLTEMQTPGTEISLHVSVAGQTLEARRGKHEIARCYPVSTSRFGSGSEPGSLRTPLGRFRMATPKSGRARRLGTVFKSRVATGQNGLHPTAEDLVLTRILWLEGLDPHNLNTLDRYIYIHGTNHEKLIGQPASHGCVRMANVDIVELYDLAEVGAEVHIAEG